MAENLHIFLDGIGRYSEQCLKTYQRLQIDNNIVINLTKPTKNSHENIEITNDLNRIKEIVTQNGIKRIFFHFLNFYVAGYLEKLKLEFPDIKYLWVFWSGDFYGHVYKAEEELSEKTKCFLERPSYFSQKKQYIKYIIKYIMRSPSLYSEKKLYKRYGYLDYVCTTFEGDYDNIINRSGVQTLKRLPYSYIDIDTILESFPTHWRDNPEISFLEEKQYLMIGHSAALGNNHIDVIDSVKSWVNKPPLLLPLSYGSDEYKRHIKERCRSHWTEKNVEYLESFLALQDYYKYLEKVKVAVFNNKVQKGFGNIIPLLWAGAKVFLRPENTMYQELIKNGIKIYNVLTEFNSENFTQLDLELIKKNRQLLSEIYSRVNVDSDILNALNV